MFFGPPAQQLFGVHEVSAAAASARLGVVLCYPHGRDYAAAHRAFRVLATRLASAGFPVLRFDLSGTGDSWGAPEQASTARWIRDIVTAIDELRGRHRDIDIALVGLRMGATLAALAAAQCRAVERLVLWEPVVDSRRYVADLEAMHREWLEAEARERRHVRRRARTDELLGFGFTDAMRRDLESVTLTSLAGAPAPDVLLLGEEPGPPPDRLARQLEALGSRVDTRVVPAPKVWGLRPGLEHAVVPAHILRTIVDWLGSDGP